MFSTFRFIFVPITLSILTSATTINPALLPTLQRFASYAGSAYCSSNYISVNHAASLPSTPYTTNAQVPELAASFLNTPPHQTTGLFLLDHANHAIIIVFRGTVSNEDWETNLAFFRSSAQAICGPNCLIHGGFFRAWNSVSDIVNRNWLTLRQRYPLYSTIVTGHSLGGALAHVCAAALKAANPNATMSLYTYASPRVGNQVFADFITHKFGSDNYRLTHLNDPVPRLPGQILGFIHAGPEYHITSPHIKNVLSASKKQLSLAGNLNIQPQDVLVLEGRTESKEGNFQYECANIAMHDAYFMQIAGCATDSSTPLLSGFTTTLCRALLMCCNTGDNVGTMGLKKSKQINAETKVVRVLDVK